MQDTLLTTGRLAARVGRGEDWVREKADQGKIPFIRDAVGRRMFDGDGLDAALRLVTKRGPRSGHAGGSRP